MATEGPGPADEPVEYVELEPIAPASTPRSQWRLGLILLVLCLLATAAIVPFSISLMRQAKDSPITPALVPVIVIVSLVIEGAMSAGAIALGIRLGQRAGLGPLMLDGVDRDPAGHDKNNTESPRRSWPRAWRAIGLAAALGVGLGAMIVGYSYASELSLTETEATFQQPSPGEGLLASIGAAIREEVWLRLGLMTLLAWLGTVIARCKSGNSTVIWTANMLSALMFGAMHLPQTAMLFDLDAALVGFVFIGNGIPGMVFGWLFWRKGLIAAMVSHFMLDLVLKVLVPSLAG